MSKRRPNGDGTVRKRPDGRWEARIIVGHKENKKSSGSRRQRQWQSSANCRRSIKGLS